MMNRLTLDELSALRMTDEVLFSFGRGYALAEVTPELIQKLGTGGPGVVAELRRHAVVFANTTVLTEFFTLFRVSTTKALGANDGFSFALWSNAPGERPNDIRQSVNALAALMGWYVRRDNGDVPVTEVMLEAALDKIQEHCPSSGPAGGGKMCSR